MIYKVSQLTTLFWVFKLVYLRINAAILAIQAQNQQNFFSHHHLNPALCDVTSDLPLQCAQNTLQFISESLTAMISPSELLIYPDNAQFFFSHLMADHCHHHHSCTSAEVWAGTLWAQDNPPVLYYKGHWLSTSIAEPLVASERHKQYDALGHHKHVPCSDEYAPKPFGVHSNELVNHEYYYNWSIADRKSVV